jgi:hypothetical protein
MYRGKNWARWLLAVLYIPTLLTWTSAMARPGYSTSENVFMGFLLALKASGVILTFVPSSNPWFREETTPANEHLQPTRR